jgi:hypothetical protein
LERRLRRVRGFDLGAGARRVVHARSPRELLNAQEIGGGKHARLAVPIIVTPASEVRRENGERSAVRIPATSDT